MLNKIFKYQVSLRSFVFLSIIVTALMTSCDSIEVEDPNFLLTSDKVFNDENTAEAAVTGIYIDMMQSNGFISGGQQSIYSLTGLSADELANYSQIPEQGQFYANEILPTNSWNELYLWNSGYDYIYQANAVLEGISGSSKLSQAVAERLRGEVLFIRGFCYFYLENLYGEIPLVLSTQYQVNRNLPPSNHEEIVNRIEEDFKEASNLLPVDYSFSSGERIRPTRWAAKAMLARLYLYNQEWEKAQEESSSIIEQTSLFQLEPDLDKVFQATSAEAIWQLLPVIPNQNTKEGLNFILLSTPYNVSLTERLVNAFSSEDERRNHWIDSLLIGENTYYFPFKYKVKSGSPISEYSMVLRLAEQYLIRAEARAQLNDLEGAQEDLNHIRDRAGLTLNEITSKEQALSAIYKERRLELFTEGGHRWLDLKRTQRTSEVLAPIKPGWESTDVLYPIPQNEINKNPHLVQNPGY